MRNFGIMSSRLRLGGTSTQPAATRDNNASRDSSDPYELGGLLVFWGVVLIPAAIVLGLTEAYIFVLLWFGLPSFPAQ